MQCLATMCAMLCCAVLCRYCDYLMECQQRAGSQLHAAAPVPQPAAKRGGGGRGSAKQRGGRGPGSSPGGQQLSADEQQVAGRELEVRLQQCQRVPLVMRHGAVPQ